MLGRANGARGRKAVTQAVQSLSRVQHPILGNEGKRRPGSVMSNLSATQITAVLHAYPLTSSRAWTTFPGTEPSASDGGRSTFMPDTGTMNDTGSWSSCRVRRT
jgi:hypothetical protein